MELLKKTWTSLTWTLSRIWFDVLILMGILWLLLYGPFDISGAVYLSNVILPKVILLSLATVHAHITRKLLFPYIYFDKETSWSNNLMVIAIYVMFIFGYSRGG
jgi:hypothetical protein